MKVPAFADIGKVSRDLLFGGKDGKFQYDKTVSFKTKAQDNVEFTVNSTMKADTVDAQLKAALKLANGISGDVTLKPESKIGVSASLAHFPGLKATLSGTVPDLNSGKVTVDYAVDYLSLKMSSALNSKPTLDLAGSTGMKGFVVGGEVGYNVEKAALSKYGIAAGYVGSGFSLAVAASDMLKTYKANYHQAIDTSSSVALEFTTKQGQEGVVSFVLGYARKMDNGAQTKVRIDQEGLLSMHYETVLEKHLKVALSAQMDALNLDGKKNKFGVALDFC